MAAAHLAIGIAAHRPLHSAWVSEIVAEPPAGRELIPDNQFRRGFVLLEPKPGKQVPYGTIPRLGNGTRSRSGSSRNGPAAFP